MTSLEFPIILPHLAATALGVAAIMHTSAPALQVLGVFMAMTFGVFVLYGFLAHAFRARVIESPRVQGGLRRGFAAAFAGLGVRLAASESST